METTYAASSDARDGLRTAIQQWMRIHVIPALAERGMPAVLAMASMSTSDDRWCATVDQLMATAGSWRDRELIGLIASVLDPYPRWTLDGASSLTDALIMRLGLRQVVTLARNDKTVLEAMVADHPKVAAMDAALNAIKLAQNEIAGIDWSPEAQRLAWAATKPAEAAGLSVTIDTCPDGDGLRLMIIDNDDDRVLLNAPYRGGVDQDGYRVRDVDLRPVVAEILALDAALPHDRDAVWPDGVSKRREELYVRAWYMARANKWRTMYQDHEAGWQVGVDHDPTDTKRPVVAVIVLPSGVQLRGHVRRGAIPEKNADVIPWDGRPRDLAGIAAWLVQG